MFAQWVTQGVEIGIKIFFAGFTVIVICGTVLGLMGIGAKVLKGLDNEDKNSDTL